MSVTHIAGNVFTVGSRKIQRCGICGEKLADNIDILKGYVITPDGPPEFLHWEPGALIQIDGNYTSVVAHEDGSNLPSDSCIDLIE